MTILVLLFALSGAAGLIYESVWARYLGLLVGHSAYAQVVVLVIFLGGMAIGSFAVGNRAERIRAPLRWYAGIEALIGLVALAFHPVFVAVSDAMYSTVLPAVPPGFLATAVMWSVAALLILPQSILLGATFPLMTAGAIRRRGSGEGNAIGLLYFANSIGASAGALIAGFALIAAFGLPGTLRCAAAVNVVVAIAVALFFGREHAVPTEIRAPQHDSATPWTGATRIMLAVSFATAFTSFFYEIAWTRMLSLVYGSATHSFELMLSAFILGLALGALWISGRIDRSPDRVALLGKLQWAMGIAAIVTLPLYLQSFDWTASLLGAIRETDAGYKLFSIARYLMSLAIMLPATFLAGTTLPLITRILMAEGHGEQSIGAVYGVNTVGSILGVALAALVLIPLLGLKGVLIAGGVMDIAVGAALLSWHGRRRADTASKPIMRFVNADRGWTVAIGGTLGLIIGVAMITPFTHARLASGVYRYARIPAEDVFEYLFYRDGRTASVSVHRSAGDSTSLTTISTNGKPDASMSPRWARAAVDGEPKMTLDQDMSTQILLPLLVLAHAPRAREGAVVGEGSGITSHILLASPELKRLHTIEIEPEMIRGSRVFYPGNRRVFDDPRSSFEIEDARAFLSASGAPFDFIVSEPSNPWVSGVSGLFTVEFYRRASARLRPGGVFTQWFHMYEMDDATIASVLAGIDSVFTDFRVYESSNSDVIIVASKGGALPQPDWSVTRFPALAEDLRHFAPLTPEVLNATVMASRQSLHPYLRSSRVNSDFHPWLDLNGERLRFRNAFATGFRELFESRLDIPAALENRPRPLGATADVIFPEIVRPSALARGTSLRFVRTARIVPLSADSVTRAAAATVVTFQRGLGSLEPPADWREWLASFVAAEEDIHSGTAGAVDEGFYKDVRAFLARAKAPGPVRVAVDFSHGLAAWDFGEAARAGDALVALHSSGEDWLPVEQVRRGTALAHARLGDFNAAARVYSTLATSGGTWTLTDAVLEEWIRDALMRRPR